MRMITAFLIWSVMTMSASLGFGAGPKTQQLLDYSQPVIQTTLQEMGLQLLSSSIEIEQVDNLLISSIGGISRLIGRGDQRFYNANFIATDSAGKMWQGSVVLFSFDQNVESNVRKSRLSSHPQILIDPVEKKEFFLYLFSDKKDLQAHLKPLD